MAHVHDVSMQEIKTPKLEGRYEDGDRHGYSDRRGQLDDSTAKVLTHPSSGVAPSGADKATSDLLFYILKMKGLCARELNWSDSGLSQSSLTST
jgi:hypothetical protein